MTTITIHTVKTPADRKAFVDLAFRLYADDPNWVPPLKSEALGMIDPKKNPWFGHGEAELFLAERDGSFVGRITAHIDHLALTQPPEQGFGPGTGFFGFFDAMDGEVAAALLTHAEAALRAKHMTRVLGPISLSVWEEPGLLTKGFDHPPTVMMGHHKPEYRAWIEQAGYAPIKELWTYDVDITDGFPPIVERIVQSGEKNSRIKIRRVNKKRFAEEAALILSILNDAWSDNWGFVPLTQDEIDDVGKKLKPLVFEDLIRIAEYEGRPVAFMLVLPDLNEALKPLNGSLLPFGWAKLLWWLRKPQSRTMRVPLMGVLKELQSSRLASQLAFMMIEFIRRDAVKKYGTKRGEIGWILDDNQGMNAISDAIESKINKIYTVFAKTL